MNAGDLVPLSLSEHNNLEELKSTNINESGDRRPTIVNTNTLYLC